jgi:hypothetical protein
MSWYTATCCVCGKEYQNTYEGGRSWCSVGCQFSEPGKASPMRWSKEAPTVAGWWWVRAAVRSTVSWTRAYAVRIDDIDGVLYDEDGHSIRHHRLYRDVEWAGPIPKPEEPDDA